jgi:hypothetical protein
MVTILFSSTSISNILWINPKVGQGIDITIIIAVIVLPYEAVNSSSEGILLINSSIFKRSKVEFGKRLESWSWAKNKMADQAV